MPLAQPKWRPREVWDPYRAKQYFCQPNGRGDGNGGIIVAGVWNNRTAYTNLLSGATQFTVALALNPYAPLSPLPKMDVGSGSPSDPALFTASWTDGGLGRQAVLYHNGGGQLELAVASGINYTERHAFTDYNVLRPGVWNRIVGRYDGPSDLLSIWVDGVNRTASVAGDHIAAINSSQATWDPISFGGVGGKDEAGVMGDWAEGAIWIAYKSDADAILYGRGAGADLLDPTGRWKYVKCPGGEGTAVPYWNGWCQPVVDSWAGVTYGLDTTDVGFGHIAPYQGYIHISEVYPTMPVPQATHPTVFYTTPAAYLPIANFGVTQTTFGPDAGLMTFTDLSLGATGWDWDFGDGSAHSTAQHPTHTFLTGRTYHVTLTVTGFGYTSNPITRWVTPAQPIAAGFTFNQNPGELCVQFLDCSAGPALTWLWNFGDGTTSTVQRPMRPDPGYAIPSLSGHLYAAAGTYTVTLTVTGTAPGSSSISQTVVVAPTSAAIIPMPATDELILPQKELELYERNASNVGKRSGTVFTCTTFAQLRDAFATAQYGDDIVIPHGVVIQMEWVGGTRSGGLKPSDSRTWTLTDSTVRMPPQAARAPLAGTLAPAGTVTPEGVTAPSASGCDPSYVLVTSDGALPAIDVIRVAVEDDPVHAILSASATVTPAVYGELAWLRMAGPYVPIMEFNAEAPYARMCSRWYIRGIRFLPPDSATTPPAGFLYGFSPFDGSSYGYDNNVLHRPDHIVFQQCVFDGDPYGYGYGNGGVVEGCAWDGSYLGIINCYIDNMIYPVSGSDPKLFTTVTGPGPFSFENNIYYGFVALYFCGGAGSNTIGPIVADWTFRRNRYLWKPEWIPSEIDARNDSAARVSLDANGVTSKLYDMAFNHSPWPGDLMVDRDTGLAQPGAVAETGSQLPATIATWPAGAPRTNLRVFWQRYRALEPGFSPLVYNSGFQTPAVYPVPSSKYATVNGTTTVTFNEALPDAVMTAFNAGESLFFYQNDTWYPGAPYDTTFVDTDPFSTGWGWWTGRPGQQNAARRKIVAIASDRLSCTLQYAYTVPHTPTTFSFPYSIVRFSGLWCESFRHYKGALENKVGQRFLIEGNVSSDFSGRLYNTSQPPTRTSIGLFALARITRNRVTLLGGTWPVDPDYNAVLAIDQDRERWGAPGGYSVLTPGGHLIEYTGACRIIVKQTSDTEGLLLTPDAAHGDMSPIEFIGPVGIITVNTPFSTLDKFVIRYNLGGPFGPAPWEGTMSYTHMVIPGGRLSLHDNVSLRYGYTPMLGAFGECAGGDFPQGPTWPSPAYAYGPGGSENWGLPPHRGDNSLIRMTHNTSVRPNMNKAGSAVWGAGIGLLPIPRKGTSIRWDDNVFSLDVCPNVGIWGKSSTDPLNDPLGVLDATVVPTRNVFGGSGIPVTKGSGFFFTDYPDNGGVSDAPGIGFANYWGEPANVLTNYVLADVASGTATIAAGGESATFSDNILPAHVQPGQFFVTTSRPDVQSRLLSAGPVPALTTTETWPAQVSGVSGDQTWTVGGTGFWSAGYNGEAVFQGPAGSAGWARCQTNIGSADMDVSCAGESNYYWPPYSATQVITRKDATATASYYFLGTMCDPGAPSDTSVWVGRMDNGVVTAKAYTGQTLPRGFMRLGLRSVGDLHTVFVNGGQVFEWHSPPGYPELTGTYAGLAGAVSQGYAYAPFKGPWTAHGQFGAPAITWDGVHPEAGQTVAYTIGFRNTASDGTDPGANIPLIQAMTTGLISDVVSAPSIAITLPTTAATYATDAATVSLSGTAFDAVGVTSVTWTNDRGTLSGTASGTATWSIADIPLLSGDNHITVTAHNAADLIGSDVITVTSGGATAPTITIQVPATDPYVTSASNVSLSGTASDLVAVTSVTWTNSRGFSGTATGTTSWSIANLPLVTGDNLITVTAHNSANQTADDTLTVTYSGNLARTKFRASSKVTV